jgi:hypothetical protein
VQWRRWSWHRELWARLQTEAERVVEELSRHRCPAVAHCHSSRQRRGGAPWANGPRQGKLARRARKAGKRQNERVMSRRSSGCEELS